MPLVRKHAGARGEGEHGGRGGDGDVVEEGAGLELRVGRGQAVVQEGFYECAAGGGGAGGEDPALGEEVAVAKAALL